MKPPEARPPASSGDAALGGGESLSWAGIYLRGLFMGSADAVPGVSGGTIALITGIYGRLIGAITGVGPWLVRDLPKLRDTGARRDYWRSLQRVDLAFLAVLGTGIVTAVITVARLLNAALEDYPAPTYAFFFGLIAASAYVLYHEVSLSTGGRIAAGVAGLSFGFVLTGITAEAGLPHNPLIIFGAGILALSAMILPGISGAFILLILGQYPYLTGKLEELTDGLAGLVSGGGGPVLRPALVVAAFLSGGVVGLLSMSRFVKWALEHYRQATLTFLVSLMLGALRLPAQKVIDGTEAWSAGVIGVTLAAALVGAGLVLVVERLAGGIEV